MLLGTLYTFTTYGTWLRGDQRGWVDNGIVLPPSPQLEAADRSRMKHVPFLFSTDDLLRIGDMIGQSLTTRIQQHIYALTVNTWHVHIVTAPSANDPPTIAKCAKEAVRYGLRPGRPIWTDDYDKRYCFDESSLSNRIAYVERHNIANGWPARPWSFIGDVL